MYVIYPICIFLKFAYIFSRINFKTCDFSHLDSSNLNILPPVLRDTVSKEIPPLKLIALTKCKIQTNCELPPLFILLVGTILLCKIIVINSSELWMPSFIQFDLKNVHSSVSAASIHSRIQVLN